MIKKLFLQMVLVMIVLGTFTVVPAFSQEGKSLPIDQNRNGNPEIVFMDYDGDGYYESFALDRDDDGVVDLWGEDANKDGIFDSFDMDQAQGDMNDLDNSLSRYRELRDVVKSTYGISNLPDTSVSIKDGQPVSPPKQPAITSNPGVTTSRERTVSPSSGVISISSAPSGAGISINGQYIGVTPMTISDVQSGTYSFLLNKDGYEEYSATATVEAGETGRVLATLSPVSEGGDITDIALAGVGVVIVLLIFKTIIKKVTGGAKPAGKVVSSTGTGIPRPLTPPPPPPQRPPAPGIRSSLAPINCINCGSPPNLTGAKFCAKCGAKLEMVSKPKFCPGCGDPVAENEKFCDKCGVKLS